MHVRVPAAWIRSLRLPAFWNRPRLATVQAPSPPVHSLSSCVPAESKWWEASGGDGAARKMPGGHVGAGEEPPVDSSTTCCCSGKLEEGRAQAKVLVGEAARAWRPPRGLPPHPGRALASASSHLASRLLPRPRSGSGDRKHSLVAQKPVAGCPPGCDCKIGWLGVLHWAWRGRNWSISGEASGVWRQREVRSLEHCGPGRFPSQRERSQARGFPGRQVRLRPLVSRSFSPPCPAAAAAYPNTLTLPTNPIMDQYLLI